MNQFNFLPIIVLARALFVAADLDIATYLSERSLSSEQLAQILHVDQNALQRLLYFLTLNGIFIKQNDGTYCNSEQSHYMSANHPFTVRPFLLHEDPARWNCLGNLGYSIKTGKPAFDYLYGKNYFDCISQDKELAQRFDDAMASVSAHEDECIARICSFYGTVIDIGGGKGQLLQKIIENKKSDIQKAILFDLPEVVNKISNGHGIHMVGGSFFEEIECKADIFILKRVLHDWDDAKAEIILRKLYNTMESDSWLYVIEGILDDGNNPKLLAAIDLLLLTIFGGKERTLSEYSDMLSRTGFIIHDNVSIADTMSLLMCKKKEL